MNFKRLLSVSSSIENKLRISCSRYSDLDDLVIAKATEFGLPLIGGTALELWAKATNTKGVRSRSDNDLDFIAQSSDEIRKFESWLKININPDKVKTDVMLVKSHDYKPWEVMVDGVLTMKPEYLLWSKLTRGSEKDKQDIKWLLSIKEMSDEDLQNILDTLGLTEDEANLLVDCLESE